MIRALENEFRVLSRSSSEPIVYEDEHLVRPLAWASDSEILFLRYSLDPHDQKPTLCSLSIFDMQVNEQIEIEDAFAVSWLGRDGHISILGELQDRYGLFDLNTRRMDISRMQEFDSSFEKLEVYPLFGHSWSVENREVALIAWPKDHLELGEVATAQNSQWSPILDTPSIQDYVIRNKDGSTMTQRDLSQVAKTKKPYRLFILDISGECIEVPATSKAHDPHWSPDGSILVFQRYEEGREGIWYVRRSDLLPRRIGKCSFATRLIVHPDGVLYCQLETQDVPAIGRYDGQQTRKFPWRRFRLSNGDVSEI